MLPSASMLRILERSMKRAMFGLVLAATALSSGGCASALSGTHDTDFDFLVEPVPAGTFQGWTNITLGEDISSFGEAELYGVSLQVETAKSPTVTDLTFLSSLKAFAVTSTGTTQLAHVSSFPRGSTTADMYIDYLGDLHPMFENDTTIHIIWTGSVNPAFTGWPSGGIWVSGDVTINLD